MELRIDPEFQNKIPPLTDDEFKQLEENILTAGEVYEPIVTWNGIIVDGHNRWKIIQAHPEISWRTRSMEFADKWAAFDWMYKNQLGRRNLTEQQRTYILGKLYEARKKTVGNHNERNEDGTFQCAQNGHNGANRVSDQIADEQGIGKETVKRAEKFSQGIDAIRDQEPEIADCILKGELPVKKADVMELSKEKDEPTLREKIEKLKKGEPIRTKPQKEAPKPAEPAPVVPVPAPQEKKDLPPARFVTSEPVAQPQYKSLADNPLAWKSGTKENREFNRQLREGNAAMADLSKTPKYTVYMMLEEMKATFELYMGGIASFYEQHPDMYTKENQAIIEAVYNNYLINKIQEIKGRIHYV